MTTPYEGATIEDVLLDVWREADVLGWKQQFVFVLQIRRLDHFAHIKDKELESIGLSAPAIRKLRLSITNTQKKLTEKCIEPSLIYVKNENSTYISPATNQTVITKDQIKLMELIGEGTFAVVKRALWYHPDGRKVDVAVKILRDVSPTVMEDLQIEANHLLKLQHCNLIRLYGVVQHPAMLVFELCEGGSLLDRLRDEFKPVPLVSTLLDYCIQIVKALTYLEAKHCVHRDIAARNILLSKDEKVVKICDFGLMRNLKDNEEMYVMAAQKKVPFSWCPPESLRHRKFSHASDVWAFGVTAWEIFSLGEEPWIGCRAIEVLERINAGERLQKPAYCSQQIYDLISLCWKLSASHRPKFNFLRGLLKEAEFNIAEVRDSHSDGSDKSLQLSIGDRVIVIENTGLLWYGQSERTRKFGTFLRSSVFVHGKAAISISTPQKEIFPMGNKRISLPIKGSFIHAAHRDGGDGQSWGAPDKIDDIYLKNPVLGKPIDSEIGRTTIIPTITDVNSTNLNISKSKPVIPKKPPTLNMKKYALTIEWDEAFDAAQNDNFSPSKIELPDLNINKKCTETTVSYDEPPVSDAEISQSSGYSTSRDISFELSVTSGISSAINRPHPTSSKTAVLPPQPISNSSHLGKIQLPALTRPPLSTISIPRPLSAGHTDDIWSRRKNITPPNINVDGYTKSSEAHSNQEPSLSDNLISELNQKIGKINSNVRFRPSPSQRLTLNETGLTLTGPDPFEISPDILSTLQKDRYNQIVEKRHTFQPQSNTQNLTAKGSSRSYLSTGIPLNGMVSQSTSCLVPIPLPLPIKSSSGDSSQDNKTAVQNPSIWIPQNQTPTAMPVVPIVTQNQIQQPRPSSSAVNVQPLISTMKPVNTSNLFIPKTSEIHAENKSKFENISHLEKEEASSTKLKEPSAKSSFPLKRDISNGALFMTDVKTRKPPDNTSALYPILSPKNDKDRHSRVDDEIFSLLPKPSALFYGNTSVQSEASKTVNGSSLNGLCLGSASTSSKDLVKTVPTVAPPVLSMNSVLEPTRLPINYPSLEAKCQSTVSSNSVQMPLFALSNNTSREISPPRFGHFPNTYGGLGSTYGHQVGITNNPLTQLMNRTSTAYGYDRNSPIQIPHASSTSSLFRGVNEETDIIAFLDPLSHSSRIHAETHITTTPQQESSPDSTLSRAEQMEILYSEAFFTDRSRCDFMVSKCNGNIVEALRQLKLEYLMDTGIAVDKIRARRALEEKNWSLNAAAEVLLS